MTDAVRFDFETLVSAIQHVHEHFATQAGKAINISLTLRNLAIGYNIREFEQKGEDRAQYGEHLLEDLANRLHGEGMNRVSARELRRFRLFYQVYPRIWQSATAEFRNLLPENLLHASLPMWESVTPNSGVSGKALITKLSFTHLTELVAINDPFRRAFYEVECIRGNWSVRELRRQIGSLYYERSGLSENKEKLTELVRSGAELADPKLAVRDPYIFEFLGIKSREVMGESDLEDRLLSNVEEFLLELGHGFCFEARQKRILIGDTHGFIDLMFYHRILKCHVLIELKIEEFTHENLGQLNTYVSWYHKNMKSEGDNPPVGLLLCTRKDQALVEYALAGMDNQLFISKYQLMLPSKADIRRFIEEEIREAGQG